MTAVLRFAPSPNGELHLGHAYSALAGYAWAQRLGGRFLVRIEDIDTVRCRPALIEAALRDLAWLGIRWELPVLRQSDHFAVYADAAAELDRLGLLYPCFATRADVERAASAAGIGVDPDGAPLYPGLYKNYPAARAAERQARGEPFAMRMHVDRAVELAAARLGGAPLTFQELDEHARPTVVNADPARWGDAVIVRKDTPTSYHLSVVVDDVRQGITHVTRGRDLYAATDLHRLIQVVLGLPEPLYIHHRLITDGDGRKLAKSADDTTLRELRDRGWTVHDVHLALGLAQGVSRSQ